MKHARKDNDRIQDPAGLIPEDEPSFFFAGRTSMPPDTLRAMPCGGGEWRRSEDGRAGPQAGRFDGFVADA